jgi:ATP-dependent DNA helicase RecQ
VTLTEDGRAVMKGERPARLLLPAAASRRERADQATRPRPAAAVEPAPARPGRDAAQPDAAALVLFEALRRHRLAVARAERVAPFIVASDRTLRDIAALRPRDLVELERAHGVGPHKAARYGAGFLQVVSQTNQNQPTTSAKEAQSR